MGVCPACKVGKMMLPSFLVHQPSAYKLIKLIHSDVVGPINPASYYKNKYFMILSRLLMILVDLLWCTL